MNAAGFVNDAFALFESRLEECAEAIRKSVRDVISDECVTGLNENLKGIVGIYRLRYATKQYRNDQNQTNIQQPLSAHKSQ